MTVEHSNYGKIIVLSIILAIPISLIFFLQPITGETLCRGDICVPDPQTFTQQCTQTTCIYNLDNGEKVIAISEHAFSWSVAGQCIQSVVDPTDNIAKCVDLYIFQKNDWNRQQILFENKLFEIFVKI